MVAKVDNDLCVGCGTCAEECPSGAITIKDEKAVVDENTCVDCGSCVEVCPTGAIKVEEKKEKSGLVEPNGIYPPLPNSILSSSPSSMINY